MIDPEEAKRIVGAAARAGLISGPSIGTVGCCYFECSAGKGHLICPRPDTHWHPAYGELCEEHAALVAESETKEKGKTLVQGREAKRKPLRY